MTPAPDTRDPPCPKSMAHLVKILGTFTNYEQRRDFHKGRVRLDLTHMQRLVEAAGNPQSQVPCIHVTGSKGKGSTVLMVEAILRAQGLSTGTFLSPHLVRLNERILRDGQPLEDEAFLAVAERIFALLRAEDALKPTFFELITAMAMAEFSASDVDVAIYEVGLGGRLDSTNVVRPEAALITTVELEHCAVLGPDLTDIAREKAGIIKAGKSVLTSLGPDHPRSPDPSSPGRRARGAVLRSRSGPRPRVGGEEGLDPFPRRTDRPLTASAARGASGRECGPRHCGFPNFHGCGGKSLRSGAGTEGLGRGAIARTF